MEEVISIHIGQAGVVAGNAIWETIALDHGLQRDGYIPDEAFQKRSKDDQNLGQFFKETGSGKLVPRAVFLDLEPESLDTVKKGYFSRLLFPEQLVSGKEDANTFARGFYTIGKEAASLALDRIRWMSDSCPNLKGFLVYMSVAGGTGSGLGSLVLDLLRNEFPKKANVLFPIFPTPKLSQSFIDPYNTILSTHHILQDSEPVSIVLDNDAVYSMCQDFLGVESPKHQDLNQIIARHVRDITAAMRFNGCLNASIYEFATNMVPYPRIGFLNSAYAPFMPLAEPTNSPSLVTLTESAFQLPNQFIKVDPKHGKFMACSITYRGLQIVPKDVCPAICSIKTKRTIQFVDWCPTGFKCGINYLPNNIALPDGSVKEYNSVSGLFNSTATKELFEKFSQQFDSMFSKRAFVHHFLADGMEELEFTEAQTNIAGLINDYKECEQDQEPEAEGEEQ